MATSAEVLTMLIPTGGWTVTGNDWSGVEFIEATPISETQFNAGFAMYDAWKAEQDADKAAAKVAAEAKLAALGLTADDLKALGL
jgi:hypothetical protein